MAAPIKYVEPFSVALAISLPAVEQLAATEVPAPSAQHQTVIRCLILSTG